MYAFNIIFFSLIFEDKQPNIDKLILTINSQLFFRKACDECGKTFISNIVLNKHKKHVHRSVKLGY